MKKEFATAKVKVKPSLKRKIAILAAKENKTEGRIVEERVLGIK